MNNSKTLFQDFVSKITLSESKEEIAGMAYLVFDHLFQISRTDILREKQINFSSDDHDRLGLIVQRINRHEPVQYVLGEAEFFGRIFKVDPSVLIPRPETEELVREVKGLMKGTSSVMDIGTGSGCIPVSLALEVPGSEVWATDVSDPALSLAKENAGRLKASVKFFHHDILNEEIAHRDLDIIVSNPPYIAPSEKALMRPNVADYEPHLALFVAENDPLLFYKALAKKTLPALKKGGWLCVEINERFGKEVQQLFSDFGFNEIRIIRDLSGKERIVRGSK